MIRGGIPRRTHKKRNPKVPLFLCSVFSVCGMHCRADSERNAECRSFRNICHKYAGRQRFVFHRAGFSACVYVCSDNIRRRGVPVLCRENRGNGYFSAGIFLSVYSVRSGLNGCSCRFFRTREHRRAERSLFLGTEILKSGQRKNVCQRIHSAVFVYHGNRDSVCRCEFRGRSRFVPRFRSRAFCFSGLLSFCAGLTAVSVLLLCLPVFLFGYRRRGGD